MYYYVVNPASGHGAINAIQDKLKAKLSELGIRGEFVKTTGIGDAKKITQAAIERKFKTIIAVGGDDTINEIINGVTDENVAIGVIPIGSTNSLANQLGITSWQQACEVLAKRRTANFGLIAANRHYFLSALTLGFETDLSNKIAPTTNSTLIAKIKYLKQSLAHAETYTPPKCYVKVDNDYEIEASVFSLTVANQKFSNPLADNKLVVSFSDKPSKRALALNLWKSLRQNQYDHINTRFIAKKIILETVPATGVMVDGKHIGNTPITIRLTNRQVRFIIKKPLDDKTLSLTE